MGLVTTRRATPNERDFGPSGGALIPRRVSTSGYTYISDDQAMRQSAVWAAVRLRANLISTLPVDAYRKVNGIQIEIPKPKILVNPGGDRINWVEWMYMSQQELDRSGNFIGVIREVDGNGNPSRIDAQASSVCKVIVRHGELYQYDVNGTRYNPDQIWHERQYPAAGMFVGLSPVAYAAYTLAEYSSIQEFTTNWFGSGAVPRARLRNVERTFTDQEAAEVKESWRASIGLGEPFVYGSDWEYDLMQANQQSADWIEAKKFDTVDIARFFDVPAELIDAAVTGESVTYANITQRNLEFLIMHLGPAIVRREKALSNLLPRPREIKLNSDALLRMDPMTRAQMLRLKIESRQLAPSEARALDNLPPFTQEQLAEFDRFWPPAPPKAQPMALNYDQESNNYEI